MERKPHGGAGKLVAIMVVLYFALFLAGKYNDQLQSFVARMAFVQTEEKGEQHTRQDYGLVLRAEESLLVILNDQRQGVSYRLDDNTEIAPADSLQPGTTVMVYAAVYDGDQEPYLAQQIEQLSAGECQRPGGELLLETGETRGTGG